MERNLNNQMFIIADDLTEQEQLSDEIQNTQNNIKEIQAYDLVQLEDDYNKAITNISKDLLATTEVIEGERQTRNEEIDKQINNFLSIDALLNNNFLLKYIVNYTDNFSG